MLRQFTVALTCALAVACGQRSQGPAPKEEPPDVRVKTLADTYLAAYFDRFPEIATFYGVPGRRHDRLTDNSLGAINSWAAREDAFLGELKQIDPARMSSGTLRATYAIARRSLEANVAKRICHDELWPASQMTGWQVTFGYLVTIQPVGTDEARRDALARWSSLPRYIDTEIE